VVASRQAAAIEDWKIKSRPRVFVACSHQTRTTKARNVMLDKLEAILRDGVMPVVIVAEPDSPYFSLMDLDAKVRPGRIIGTVGFIDSKPVSALDEPLEPEVIDALAVAYVSYVFSRYRVIAETRH
jgi:hypothetical protein